MIFRKFKNGEEISFCNVDTPEEALELMFDPYAIDHDEIMAKMVPTIYGYQAAMGRKPDGEPGDFWDIKGYASADDEMPAVVRKIEMPMNQLLSIQQPDAITLQLSKEDAKWLKIFAEGMEKTLLNSIEESLYENETEGNIDTTKLELYKTQLPWWHRIKESIEKGMKP